MATLARYLFVLFLVVVKPISGWSEVKHTSSDIRLVLQLTVDGLRGDLLNRYGDRFDKGGFRYLLEKGTVYANAHYQHANTETIVGHATLATGAFPSDHGMVGNVWYDRETGELAYNIEDPEAPLIPTREESNVGTQVDPAQKLSRTQGRSPASKVYRVTSSGPVAQIAISFRLIE